MLKFISYFALIQLSLFSIQQLKSVREFIIIPFTENLALISTWIIQIFDENVRVKGIILQQINTGFSVSIESGCNGVEAVIVLISAMLVFPSSWKYKLQGIAVGFFAIQLLNIIRIISLFYLGQWDYDIFEWAHLYLWEVLIMLDVLIIFLGWLRYLPRTSNPDKNQLVNTQNAE